jgi:hypothetical protein
MATCRECLEEIVWIDRSDGGGRIPCEYVDKRGSGLYVLEPNSLRVAWPQPPMVLRHRCDRNKPFPELILEGEQTC